MQGEAREVMENEQKARTREDAAPANAGEVWIAIGPFSVVGRRWLYATLGIALAAALGSACALWWIAYLGRDAIETLRQIQRILGK